MGRPWNLRYALKDDEIIAIRREINREVLNRLRDRLNHWFIQDEVIVALKPKQKSQDESKSSIGPS